jgi:voltage-gated potassium channel
MSDPSTRSSPPDAPASLRERLWHVVFLSDTPAGKAFDVVLLWLIALSVLVVMLESIDTLRARYLFWFRALEWTFTVIFSIEYVVRLSIVRNRRKYALSFYGLVDLVAILPTYLEVLLTGPHYLMTVRVLRLLRMFRVLKMAEYVGEASALLAALSASRRKINLFLFAVLTLVAVEGTIIYMLEQAVNPGFANIPQSIYWAIVTITTVGYGDVAPVTVLGKVMASIIMLTGFAIIAVPTGIVTAEMNAQRRVASLDDRRCHACGRAGHEPDARFCAVCGKRLDASP